MGELKIKLQPQQALNTFFINNFKPLSVRVGETNSFNLERMFSSFERIR